MSDEEKPKPPSLFKKELDELKSKQVENRKRFMQTSIVYGPEVESFDGAGTKSQNDEISIQPESFKAVPFKNQLCNTDPNQTGNKSKQVEILIDGPQVESFDGAGTESQNDDISIQPGSSKAGPFKNQSINTNQNQTENKSKQVEIRKRVVKSTVDGPQIESFDGAGTISQNDEISVQPRSFKSGPFKNQSINTSPPDAKQTENHFKQVQIRVLKSLVDHPLLNQNQTENKSKQVKIRKRVVKSTVDSPQVQSFDDAGTKSQNDEISSQPGSFKAVPFKNHSMNTDPNQTSRGETINEEEKSKFKCTGLFKKESDEQKAKQVEIRKRLNKELEAKLITLNKNKENLSPTSPLIEDSFRKGCKISVLLFYVFFF